MRVHLTCLGLAGVLAREAGAQSSAAKLFVGTWRGTSTCLVRPSACNDEVTVYRIAPMKAPDSASVDARKVVNGKEEEMGVLDCRATPPTGRLACRFPRGVWYFSVRKDSLIGELRLPDSTRFRDVRAVRAP